MQQYKEKHPIFEKMRTQPRVTLARLATVTGKSEDWINKRLRGKVIATQDETKILEKAYTKLVKNLN